MPIPKVSIVIPVYNGANYLAQAIDSALAQTYENIEVLVVNDGSTDQGETESIAKSYGERIRYFYKENGGVSSALNLGIKKMEGQFFSWLSHDDIYCNDKIEVQINALSNNEKVEILFSDYEIIDETLTVLDQITFNVKDYAAFFDSLFPQSIVHACTFLIPKVCFEEIGMFNENLKYVQDNEMLFRLLKKYSFKHVPRILIKGRQHQERGCQVMRDPLHEQSNWLFSWVLDFFSCEELHEYADCKPPYFYLKLFFYYKERDLQQAATYAIKKLVDFYGAILDLDKCIQVVDEIIDQNYVFKKKRADVFVAIGGELRSRNDVCWRDYYYRAITVLETLKEINIFFVQQMASLYKELDETERAKKYYAVVLGESGIPAHLAASALFHLGEISLHEKRIENAKEYFTRCLEYNVEHQKAKAYLADLCHVA